MGAIVYRNEAGLIIVLRVGRYDELSGGIIDGYSKLIDNGVVRLLRIPDDIYTRILNDPFSCNLELDALM